MPSGRRTSFRAEIYEWQIAALLATARVDEAAKARIVTALWRRAACGRHAAGRPPRAGASRDRSRQCLRSDERRRLSPAEGRARGRDRDGPSARARRGTPSTRSGRSAISMISAPSGTSSCRTRPTIEGVRREYELRRAEATAVAFDRLEALGPVIVEAKLSDGPDRRRVARAVACSRARRARWRSGRGRAAPARRSSLAGAPTPTRQRRARSVVSEPTTGH